MFYRLHSQMIFFSLPQNEKANKKKGKAVFVRVSWSLGSVEKASFVLLSCFIYARSTLRERDG